MEPFETLDSPYPDPRLNPELGLSLSPDPKLTLSENSSFIHMRNGPNPFPRTKILAEAWEDLENFPQIPPHSLCYVAEEQGLSFPFYR